MCQLSYVLDQLIQLGVIDLTHSSKELKGGSLQPDSVDSVRKISHRLANRRNIARVESLE